VHTELTLAAANTHILVLRSLIQQPLIPCSMLDLKLIDEGMQTRGTDWQKSWKFPKFHLLSHAFSGISEKGVTANYNTKLNKHEHGETRITFESGNWKDVAAQAISLLPSNSFCYAHFFLDHQAQSVCGSAWHDCGRYSLTSRFYGHVTEINCIHRVFICIIGGPRRTRCYHTDHWVWENK